jgi:uncharacterized coiled-coil protein SlyX
MGKYERDRVAVLESRIEELERRLAQREKDVRYQSDNYQATHAKWEQSQRELARVKAESLRVVKVGEEAIAGEIKGLNGCILDGRPYWAYHDQCGQLCLQCLIDGHPAISADDTIVQPVRLERWERPAKNNPDTRQ